MDDNAHRFNSKNTPYFLKDNEQLEKTINELSFRNVENELVSKAYIKAIKTEEQKQAIQQRWNERKGIIEASYPNITSKIIDVENLIRKNAKFETAVAFDSNGKIIIDKRGAATSVSFTSSECNAVKDCIFTHNHPRGWSEKSGTLGRIGNSFSHADISFAIGNNLAEIRAVTPLYTFVMKRPINGWGISVPQMSEQFRLIENRIKIQIIEKINKVANSKDKKRIMRRASALHFHLIWKELAKRQGLEYKKIKSAR